MSKAQPKSRDVAGSQYAAILARVEALEDDCDLVADLAEGVEDGGPDFVWRCLYGGSTAFRKNLGFDRLQDGITAKRVGAIIGCKVSLFDAMARTHHLFERLSTKQLKEIEDAWGAEVLADARKEWKRCAEEFKPRTDELRRFASDECRAWGYQEQIDYGLGYLSGFRMIEEVAKKLRRLRKGNLGKRDKDLVAHNAVLWFAATNWKWIEENRRKLTWMELTEAFDKETNHEIPIDEETFKKILQRASLTIGKSSRRMNKGRSRTSAKGGCP